MKGDAGVPFAGALVGVVAMVLVAPLLPQWYWPIVVGVPLAAVTAYLLGQGVHRLPGASPKVVAWSTTVGLGVATGVAVVGAQGRTDAELQTLVLFVAPFAGFRLVVAVVDRFTPSFTVSLLAGLTGMLVFAAAVPLLVSGHPDWSTWSCIATAAGTGCLLGILVGVLLRPLFATEGRG